MLRTRVFPSALLVLFLGVGCYRAPSDLEGRPCELDVDCGDNYVCMQGGCHYSPGTTSSTGPHHSTITSGSASSSQGSLGTGTGTSTSTSNNTATSSSSTTIGTFGTAGTTGTFSSTGTTGETGAQLCAPCSQSSDCASGYCNQFTLPNQPFCDSAHSCVNNFNECHGLGCWSGDDSVCACPQLGNGTTFSTGSSTSGTTFGTTFGTTGHTGTSGTTQTITSFSTTGHFGATTIGASSTTGTSFGTSGIGTTGTSGTTSVSTTGTHGHSATSGTTAAFGSTGFSSNTTGSTGTTGCSPTLCQECQQFGGSCSADGCSCTFSNGSNGTSGCNSQICLACSFIGGTCSADGCTCSVATGSSTTSNTTGTTGSHTASSSTNSTSASSSSSTGGCGGNPGTNDTNCGLSHEVCNPGETCSIYQGGVGLQQYYACACNPGNGTTIPDGCMSSNQFSSNLVVCDSDTMRCRPPKDFEPVASQGPQPCAPGYASFNFGTLTDGGQDLLCVEGCSQNTDCSLAYTTCTLTHGSLTVYASDGGTFTSPGYCSYNQCGPTVSANQQYYGPCNAVGTNDGTCQPFPGGGGYTGLCFRTGTAATGQSCKQYPTSSADLCSGDGLCASFGQPPDPCQPVQTAECLPTCNVNSGVSGPTTPACPLIGASQTVCNALQGDPANNVLEAGLCY